MGENASKIGKKLEGFWENFADDLGWSELARDKEIKCNRFYLHKKRTHGIDLLCMFNNPYINGNQGIIVECKNRQMRSINKTEIEGWIEELIYTIECAQSTDEFSDLDLSDVSTQNTGLLLIHANENWNEEKFYEYLHSITVKNRRNPINIFIAGNDRINTWTSLFAKIKSSYSEGFSFVYPSLNEYSKKLQNALTINAMFSKYLFAVSNYSVKYSNEAGGYSVPCTQKIMFFLDDICIENFKYAWSMFKHYQMQGSSKYVFVFFPKKAGDIELVKESFITTVKNVERERSDEIDKICIDFIDNRSISPVEYGGLS